MEQGIRVFYEVAFVALLKCGFDYLAVRDASFVHLIILFFFFDMMCT